MPSLNCGHLFHSLKINQLLYQHLSRTLQHPGRNVVIYVVVSHLSNFTLSLHANEYFESKLGARGGLEVQILL